MFYNQAPVLANFVNVFANRVNINRQIFKAGSFVKALVKNKNKHVKHPGSGESFRFDGNKKTKRHVNAK